MTSVHVGHLEASFDKFAHSSGDLGAQKKLRTRPAPAREFGSNLGFSGLGIVIANLPS